MPLHPVPMIRPLAVAVCLLFLGAAPRVVLAGDLALGRNHTCALWDGYVMCWGQNATGELGTGTQVDSPTPLPVNGLPAGITAVAAGLDHTCALTGAGGVKCWGDNQFGQLGDGGPPGSFVPVDVSGLAGGVTQITAGGGHTCALTAMGSVSCWGRNSSGQVGDGTLTDRPTPVPVFANGVIAISAGNSHTCALMATGQVQCWGLNNRGQVGDGTTTSPRPSPNYVNGATNVTAIAAGGLHTCTLTAVGDLECWGSNGSGELGDGTLTDSPDPVSVLGISGVVAITAGWTVSCALTDADAVWCWGNNNTGQLGDGTTTTRPLPTAVTGVPAGVTAIGTRGQPNQGHTCARLESGRIKCWGNNFQGEVGDGTTISPRLTPVDVRDVFCGDTIANPSACDRSPLGGGGLHACGRTFGGGAMCWGSNIYGQIGDGTMTTTRSTATSVNGLSDTIIAVAGGGDHTCALTSANGVECWGRNAAGGLGDGTTTNSSVPVGVSGLASGIVAVIPGLAHTCAITREGAALCWGYNIDGQLGDGTTTTPRLTPVPVSGLTSGVVAMAASEHHTCAVTDAGAVECWGKNPEGELGNGGTSGTPAPTPGSVSGLTTGVTDVVTGIFHTCALTAGGGVKCWGRNNEGQLGDGTTSQRVTPVDVSGLTSGVVAITAGAYHTCALTSTGGVKCWGWNIYGQVGDATTTTPRTTPVDASQLTSGVAAIAAGFYNTCALTAAGPIKCWGRNEEAQLGDGTTMSPGASPQDVVGWVYCGDGVIQAGEECDGSVGCGLSCRFPCALEGEWTTGGGILGIVTAHLRESSTGEITGIGYLANALPSAAFTIVGSHQDTVSVALGLLPNEPPWTGRRLDCNHLLLNSVLLTRQRVEFCGDGIKQVGWEQCDDENWTNGDGCTAICTYPQCRNGVTEPGAGEQCDDGNSTMCDACTNACETRVCGDGTRIEACEACDDGNTDDGDGCSGECTVYVCGDGVLEKGEQCDDGNTLPGDGCDAACLAEGCDFTGAWKGKTFRTVAKHNETFTVYVDGQLISVTREVGEQRIEVGTLVIHDRETAGTIAGSFTWDGKDAQSALVSGQRTAGQVSLTVNGTVMSGIIYPCNSVVLRYRENSYTNNTIEHVLTRERPTYCGNVGMIEAADEACDDGNFNSSNTNPGDTCSALCRVGRGCGNGLREGTEQCDDGNASNNDGCAACKSAFCGDGYLRTTVEACDDGNANPNDGCDACQLVTETKSGPLGGTAVVTTDTEGDGATQGDPIETTLRDPCGVGGSATITEAPTPPGSPSGLVFMGTTVTVTRTGNTVDPACPLYLVFRLHPSVIPPGQGVADLKIYKDGVELLTCGQLGAPSAGCIDSRYQLPGGGDYILTVRTTTLSDWTFGNSVCGNAPAIGCLAATPRGAKLKLVDGAKPAVSWSWKGLSAFAPELFGDPVGTSDVTLCAYDDAGRILAVTAPTGGTCGTKPCWKTIAKGGGVSYQNKLALPDGAGKLVLKSGAAGKGKIQVKGGGPALQMPSLPLAGPIRVQLRSAEGACFEANFGAAAVNTSTVYRATSD